MTTDCGNCMERLIVEITTYVVVKSVRGGRRPTTGQRLEDECPEGQNLAQSGFGSRQPPHKGGKPKAEAM